MRDGVYVIELFIRLVDGLLNMRIGDNEKIYIETQDGRLYNFKAAGFRKHLGKLIAKGEKEKEFLQMFKTLHLIIAEGERFTQTQWINNKSHRVISVDAEKYKLLKSLKWRNE